MRRDSEVAQRTGGISIGFTGILTIVFVIGRMTGLLDWGWGWVFSPLWLPVAALLGIAVIIIIIALLATLKSAIVARFRRRFGKENLTIGEKIYGQLTYKNGKLKRRF